MTEYAVINPATGETLATYPTITDDALDAVIEKADAAYRTWRDTPVAERAALVRRVAELHRERRDELAAIIVREMGKPLAAAEGEVDFAADITEYYADNAEKITGDQPLDILGEGTAVIRRTPIGVLLGIMPWNFPYYQVARFAAPNLVLGNTIIPEARLAVPGVGGGHRANSSRRRAARGGVHEHLRDQRAGRDRHRGPPRRGRFDHRFGARRRRRRRGRRAQPQEGRARARRIRPVHPAVDR